MSWGAPLETVLAGTVRSASPEDSACALNFLLDERIADARKTGFGQRLKGSSWDDLVEQYTRYYNDSLVWDGRVGSPEPFTALNAGAGLGEAPDEGRELVRVVKIGWLTTLMGIDLDRLNFAVTMVRSGTANKTTRDAQRPIVEQFVAVWNSYRPRPPSFVGFLSDVRSEVTELDVFDRLRNRFGLGHLHVPPGAAAIPVMLLRYKIGRIIDAAKAHLANAASHSFRVPTTLESNFYTYFCPSPTPFPYGRTVDLDDQADASRLASELIHFPVDLQVEDIVKVGMIETPIPDTAASANLAALRAAHIRVLRKAESRPDFAEPWVPA